MVRHTRNPPCHGGPSISPNGKHTGSVTDTHPKKIWVRLQRLRALGVCASSASSRPPLQITHRGTLLSSRIYSTRLLESGTQFAKKMGKPLVNGLPERYFAKSLLWEQTNTIEEREAAFRIHFWSWAAWRGRIMYELGIRVWGHWYDFTLSRMTVVFVKSWKMRHGPSKMWTSTNLSTLPVVESLYPAMRHMPNNDDSLEWQASIQSPWTVASHERID